MSDWWTGLSRAQRRFTGMCVLLGLACLWLYGVGNARYGLFDVDEAIFTQATIEMRHSGELSMPTYNGEPRYHKPPLIYWAQDAAMGLLGEHSLLAARLPSILGALGTILILGIGVARLTGSRRWGLMSALCMGLNLSFLVVGRAATADGLLNVTSVALALWVVRVMYPAPAALGKEHGTLDAARVQARMRRVAAELTVRRRQWWVTGVLAALGFLAKGPVAWFPAAFMVAAVLVFRKDKAVLWRRLAPVKSGLLALGLLLPWVGLLLWQFGAGFFYDFFIQQNLHRYAGGLTNTQSSSHLYYLAVILFGFFPWVFLLPKGVGLVLKGGIRRVRAALSGEDAAKALPYLALVWAVAYVLFFSFSKTKLAHYVVPAYPALAILAGMVLAQAPKLKTGSLAAVLGGALGLLLACVMLVLDPVLLGLRHATLTGWLGWLQAVFGFAWPPKDAIAAATLALPVSLDAAPVFVGLVLAFCVVPAWFLVARGKKGGILVLSLSWAVCLGLIAWGVVPMVARYTQAPLAEMAAVIAAAPAGDGVIHLGLHKPSVLYLSGRRFVKLDSPLQVPENLTQTETLVLTETDKVVPLVTELGVHGGAQVLGQRCQGGYCLLVVGKPGQPDGI